MGELHQGICGSGGGVVYRATGRSVKPCFKKKIFEQNAQQQIAHLWSVNFSLW